MVLAVMVGIGGRECGVGGLVGHVGVDRASSSDLSTDFRMGYVDDIDFQANIFASYNSTPYFIFTEVYDLLLNYDVPTGAPDLKNSPAYKYKMSKDGLTITYWLHPNMKWSDGKPFTSADVVWSYEHAADSQRELRPPPSQHQERHGAQPDGRPAEDEALRRAHPVGVRADRAQAHLGAARGQPGQAHPLQPVLPDGRHRGRSRSSRSTPTAPSVLVPNKYFYGPHCRGTSSGSC